MIKRKSVLLGTILAVILLAGATSCAPGDLKTFEGVLQKVDSLSGNVTVTLTDNTTMTFNLKDVDLTALRKAMGNPDLEPGDNVTIKKDRNGEVKELKSPYAVVQGTIKSLSTENVTSTTANVTAAVNKMTITAGEGDITLLVTPKTMILGWGSKKPVFNDLKVGQRVVVRYEVSAKQAISITINADGKIQENKKFNSENKSMIMGNRENQANKGPKK
jgi:hypothetical protein